MYPDSKPLIIKAILEAPEGLSAQDIADETGLFIGTVARHIRTLREVKRGPKLYVKSWRRLEIMGKPIAIWGIGEGKVDAVFISGLGITPRSAERYKEPPLPVPDVYPSTIYPEPGRIIHLSGMKAYKP